MSSSASTSEEFVQALRVARAMAILRAHDTALAGEAMEAAIRGGFRVVEFTFTTPGAASLIAHFAARPELIVGAGTVMTVEEADAAIDAGARFLVSPIVDGAVIRHVVRRGVAMIPGAHTPTEMVAAHQAGAPLIKLFPETGAGPAFVRQLLGPLPGLKIVPTAGVDEKNAAAYLEAGAWAVGFVSSLFDPEEMAAHNVASIEARALLLLRGLGNAS